MATLLSENSLIDFLESEATDLPPQIGATGDGLCLLVGARAMRNLRDGLIQRGIEPKQVAEYETVQSVSRRLLEQRYSGDPRVLSQRVSERLLRDVVNNALDGNSPPSLENLINAAGETWDDELYEALGSEVEQYWRGTDAGEDHNLIAEATASLDDPYARYRNERALSGFAALSAVLEERTEPLPPAVFLSESHLTREARIALKDEWNRAYGDIDWIAVGTIKNVDNGLLRFFQELDSLEDGPDLYFSFGKGSQDRIRERFRRVGIDAEYQSSDQPRSSQLATELVDVATHGSRRDSTPDEVQFVDAPDRRREVTRVAHDIASNVDKDGANPGDYLIVVRETSEYEAIIDDVFTTHGIPFHVESDRPMAQTVAYRFLKSTVDLIAAATSSETVSYHDIVDPLRLGFCPLESTPGEWPLDDTSFLELEERLHAAAGKDGNDERTLETWYNIASAREADGIAWNQLTYFISWVIERSQVSSPDGDDVSTLLNGLCRGHVVNIADTPLRRLGGPGVDATRTDLTRKHPTFLAERVSKEIDGVGRYYQYILDLDLSDAGWELAAQALGDVIGRGQYSASNTDGNAVRVVIPANTYYLSAKHTFLLGAGAGEFPTQQPTSTFLHDDLSRAVEEYAVEGPEEAAYLHLSGDEGMYRRELDDYESTVRTPARGLTISRHARNSEGDHVTWSPFVAPLADGLDEDNPEYDRIRLSEWLPAPTTGGDWEDVTPGISMRNRIRLLAYYVGNLGNGGSFTPRLKEGSVRSEGAAIHLLSSVDGAIYQSHLVPRYERFLRPPTSVTVQDGEPAFDDLTLSAVISDPIRAHEVDLFGQCQLKYYFYQHLVAREGNTIHRDEWPEKDSPYASELYPTVPTLLSNHYAPQSYRVAIRRLVSEYLPDRQADLGEYDDVGSLRAAFDEWVSEDELLDESVFQALVGEYLTVSQECDRGIERSWSWRDTERIELDGREVLIPSHRTDNISEVDGSVPVFQSGRQGGAQSAFKHCWSGSVRGEHASEVCWSCDGLDRCSITTKHAIDTRVRASVVDGRAGALIHDRYTSSPSGRHGFLTSEDLKMVDHEQNVQIHDRLQTSRTKRWKSDLEDLLNTMASEAGHITYSVSKQFVENGGCEGCTYRDLCGIPNRIEEGTGGDV